MTVVHVLVSDACLASWASVFLVTCLEQILGLSDIQIVLASVRTPVQSACQLTVLSSLSSFFLLALACLFKTSVTFSLWDWGLPRRGDFPCQGALNR